MLNAVIFCYVPFERPIDARCDMADKAKLSTKFQIVIPKWIREAQDWRSGQEFVLLPQGKGVLVMPVPDRDDLLGLAEGARPVSYRDRSDRI